MPLLLQSGKRVPTAKQICGENGGVNTVIFTSGCQRYTGSDELLLLKRKLPRE